MAVIDTINVGGADYRIQDATARDAANTAVNKANAAMNRAVDSVKPTSVDLENHEYRSDNTYSVDRPTNDFFYWFSENTSTPDAEWLPLGMWMRTTKPVTAGTLIRPGTNCEMHPMSAWFKAIKVIVGSDGKLHYQDYGGADTALNFSGIQRRGFIHVSGSTNYAYAFFDLYGLPGNTGFRFWGMRTETRKRVHVATLSDEIIYDSGQTYASEITFNSKSFSNPFDARIYLENFDDSDSGPWQHAWYELITI